MSDWLRYLDANPMLFIVPLLLATLLLAEIFWPCRNIIHFDDRWTIHTALYLINILIAAVLMPGNWALGGGIMMRIEQEFGALAAGAIGLLVLDLAFYLLHRAQHASALLWRLHMVHHSDLEVDVTTAVRHHPGEILFNCLVLGALTILLGIPPGTIAIYGTIMIAVQMIQHANLNWPIWLERAAGLIIVTPAMHHRHHSSDRHVSDANFGVVFSVWDRFFRSLNARSPVAEFGVAGIDWLRCGTLWGILALPLTVRPDSDGEAAE